MSIYRPNSVTASSTWTYRQAGTVTYTLPPSQSAGRWIRFSGAVIDPLHHARMRLTGYRANGDVVLSSPIAHCVDQVDSQLCTSTFWMPQTAHETQASLTWAGSPGHVRKLVIEVANDTPDETIKARSNHLLALIRKRYFKSDQVDWPAIEAKLAVVPSPPLGTDPSAMIAQQIISDLPDHKHTYVMPRSSLEVVGDTPWPSCEPIEHGAQILTIPLARISTPSSQQRFADIAAACIRAEDDKTVWLIDLRNNGGGFLWPMLGALSPFFGRSTLYSYRRNDASIEAVSVSQNGVAMGTKAYDLKLPDAGSRQSSPVIVVVSNQCVSMCEAMAVAFLHRANTLVVGQDTGGYVTSDSLDPLDSEYVLALTEYDLADACGVLVDDRVRPQVKLTAIDHALLVNVLHDPSIEDWRRRHHSMRSSPC